MGITGKWKIVEAELGGQQLPASGFEKTILDMDENSYQLLEDKVIESGILQLLPGSSPKTMIITSFFGPNKGKTFQCIYEFEGEDLIMCYNLEGSSIPASFQTFENALLYRVRYRRIADR
jgi:uncharacterized protein (TIGR03067 family)